MLKLYALSKKAGENINSNLIDPKHPDFSEDLFRSLSSEYPSFATFLVDPIEWKNLPDDFYYLPKAINISTMEEVEAICVHCEDILCQALKCETCGGTGRLKL